MNKINHVLLLLRHEVHGYYLPLRALDSVLHLVVSVTGKQDPAQPICKGQFDEICSRAAEQGVEVKTRDLRDLKGIRELAFRGECKPPLGLYD